MTSTTAADHETEATARCATAARRAAVACWEGKARVTGTSREGEARAGLASPNPGREGGGGDQNLLAVAHLFGSSFQT